MDKVKWIFKEIIKYLLRGSGIAYIIGLVISKVMFRDKEKIYIFIYPGIGDILLTRGYLDAYLKKKHPNKKPCLVVLKSCNHIYNLYNDNYERIIMPKYIKKLFTLYAFTDYGFYHLDKIDNLFISYSAFNLKTCWNYFYALPGTTFMYFIKYGLMGLDENAVFTFPNMQIEHNELVEKYQLKNKKFIILNPFANTVNQDELSVSFWKDLAFRFIEKGYLVFTDCGKGGKSAIEGTEPLVSTLKELYDLVQYSTAYIGVRSGIQDLISLTGCNVVALYPKTPKNGHEYYKAFDVSQLCDIVGLQGNTSQYVIENENEIISTLLERF